MALSAERPRAKSTLGDADLDGDGTPDFLWPVKLRSRNVATSQVDEWATSAALAALIETYLKCLMGDDGEQQTSGS